MIEPSHMRGKRTKVKVTLLCHLEQDAKQAALLLDKSKWLANLVAFNTWANLSCGCEALLILSIWSYDYAYIDQQLSASLESRL